MKIYIHILIHVSIFFFFLKKNRSLLFNANNKENYKEFVSLYLNYYGESSQNVKFVLFIRNYNDYSYYIAKGKK